jgi:predicted Zn-dependent protease
LGGKLARLEGQRELAERCLGEAFRREPGIHGHGKEYAELLAEVGRLDEALSVIARALEHRPGDPYLVELLDKIEADLRGRERTAARRSSRVRLPRGSAQRRRR